MLRPLPRASAPPRSATRLSLAQPEASLVIKLMVQYEVNYYPNELPINAET